ncbi:MAG: hypothetical protein VX335_03705 [Pseudomonadota bacterium]|nr:hypothetical protein [Pseudomonadota bacterium]
MKLYLKPVIAATLLSLVTTPALAYKDKKSKGAPTDSARVSASMDELMNPMAPKRDAYFSIKDKISFNFDLTAAAQYSADWYYDNTAAASIRAARIYSDLSIQPNLDLHTQVYIGSTLSFNRIPNDGVIDPQFYVDELYLTYHNKTNPNMYAKFGIGYGPFGTYKDPYEVTFSLNQAFVQAQANRLELGAKYDNGLSLQLFQYQTNTIHGAQTNDPEGAQGWNQPGIVVGYDTKLFGKALKTKLSFVQNVSFFNGAGAQYSYLNFNLPVGAYDFDVSLESSLSKLSLSYYKTDGTAFGRKDSNDNFVGLPDTGRPSVISLGYSRLLNFGIKDFDVYINAEKTLHASEIKSGYGVESLASSGGSDNNYRGLGPEFSDTLSPSDAAGFPEYQLSAGLKYALNKETTFALDYTLMLAYKSQVDMDGQAIPGTDSDTYSYSYLRMSQNQITASVKYEL